MLASKFRDVIDAAIREVGDGELIAHDNDIFGNAVYLVKSISLDTESIPGIKCLHINKNTYIPEYTGFIELDCDDDCGLLYKGVIYSTLEEAFFGSKEVVFEDMLKLLESLEVEVFFNKENHAENMLDIISTLIRGLKNGSSFTFIGGNRWGKYTIIGGK